jgi:hypothetical protein
MGGFNMDNYVDVPTRLRLALEKYPELSIQESRPTVVSMEDGKQYLEVTTRVWRHPADPLPIIVSCWEEYPGTTPYTRGAEQQNASTSSLGRALGMLGFGIKTSIASREDVERRQPAPVASTKVITSPETGEKTTITRIAPVGAGGATPGQMGKIRALANARGASSGRGVVEAVSNDIGRKILKLDELTKQEASDLLDKWKNETPALTDEEPF